MKTSPKRALDHAGDATVDRDRSRDIAPAAAVRHVIMGFRTTQLIYVAARLGIADLLEDSPQAASALASAVGVDPRALYRLVSARWEALGSSPRRPTAASSLRAVRPDAAQRRAGLAAWPGTGHFYDASGDAYLDAFSCKDFGPEVAIEVVKRHLSPRSILRTELVRDASPNAEEAAA